MSAPKKKFVLKHVFQDVRNLKENEYQRGPTEEHFNVSWTIGVTRRKGYLAYYLYCLYPKTTEWSITIEREARLISVGGKVEKRNMVPYKSSSNNSPGVGWHEFIKWEDMEKDYMTDGNITIEEYIKISKMTGIAKKKLRNFDSNMDIFSDVILTVENEKFYVSKLFLATQSSFFESILSKKQRGSKKPEIKLDGCKSEDFQNFLELIYGESPIDDETIDGILQLADMYNAGIALKKCEEFLIRYSEKTLKEKLKIAKQYDMDNLMDGVLSRIKNVADIRSVLSYDVSEMDPSVVAALLQKALSYLP
ncbi:hypothetical protein GCK72_007378 [Caenorhabditis remanei]|uniref:BTB domain-containing protein n=1 Tax=Caenorhabditis remanei TaxID=31234 RepID=A0A6A5HJ04_CAERE|nr:hypothetical protein GCK72_007378 [Caenorhabditis remanei]KAF1767419.1 hypothetical protein GCK72_007378 [Caenorhabditis remanei]